MLLKHLRNKVWSRIPEEMQTFIVGFCVFLALYAILTLTGYLNEWSGP